MARSIAAPAPRRIAERPAGARASSAPWPLSAVAGAARTIATLLARWPRLRIALLALIVALPALGGGWLWLRSSPFVAVQRVQIAGVHGPEAASVDAALTAAARRMSTLDVSAGALQAAVAPLRVVRSLRAIPSFPHGLRILVSEQLPVASLTAAGARTAVAGDGVALGPSLLTGSLPTVSAGAVPQPGRRVGAAGVQAELTVLGAAPAALLAHVERVFNGAKGITAAMRNGLLVYFGGDGRPHAKWLSLARVLADPSSVGASYVDVRLPSHPAAGFPAGVTPPDASATAATGSGESTPTTESTVASLAAGLSNGSSASGSAAAASASAPGSSTASTASTAGEPGASGEPSASGEAGAPGEAGETEAAGEPAPGSEGAAPTG